MIRAFTEETPQYDKVKWKEVGDDDMERVRACAVLCALRSVSCFVVYSACVRASLRGAVLRLSRNC